MGDFKYYSVSIEDAIVRNKGRQILPNWIQQFTEATDYSISSSDFLELVETKRIRTLFYDRVKFRENCLFKEWSIDCFEEVTNYLLEVDKAAGSVEVYLLSDVDTYIGALQIHSSIVFYNVHSVWELVHDDLSLTSLNLQDGLCLERNYYSNSGEYHRDGLYQLTSWGSFNRNEE